MELVNKIIKRNLDKRLIKSIKITNKIDDIEDEYQSMKDQLSSVRFESKFVDEYFKNKINRLKSKLARNESLMIKSYEKLVQRGVIREDDFFHER